MSRYLSAGIHGDEPAGPLAALELLRAGAFDHGCWRLCPALNPTGLAAGTRDTADGIDLNRDYWHRRSREVRAHADWLKSRPCPSLFLSLHEDWEYPGFYFYEINLGDDRPERAEAIRAAVSPWLPAEASPLIDGHAVRGLGWIFHAAEADLAEQWPEAIFLAKRGCPLSITYETPTGSPLATRIAAHVAGVQAVLRGEERFDHRAAGPVY
ncbi:MAG: M14 family metallocarboxypeptidase [Verrucomicrobiales bacterium]